VVAKVVQVMRGRERGLPTHRTVKPPLSAATATQRLRVRCSDRAFRALVALTASARVS